MKKTEKELTIGISTTYEGAGVEAARENMEALSELSREAAGRGEQPGGMSEEDARAQAEALAALTESVKECSRTLRELTEARQEQEAGAQEVQVREEELRREMELEGKSVKELRAEVLRLARERKEAAAAGDAAAYKRLTEEYGRCKGALKELTNQGNLQKAALMGQASAGMQFAQGLQSLGTAAASGSTDMAGMANQALSLGMALQAGLGPIGMLMGSMQLLQSAVDAFVLDKIRREIAALDEEAQRMWAAFDKSLENNEKLRAADLKQSMGEAARQLEDYRARQREIAEEARRAREEQDAEAARRDEEERRRAEEKLLLTRGELDVLRTAGQISEQSYRRRIRLAEQEAAAVIEGVQRAAAVRENKAAVSTAQSFEEEARRLEAKAEEIFKPLEGLLRVQMPTPEEWERLQLRLDEGVADAEERVRAAQIEAVAGEMRDELVRAGFTIGSGTLEVLKWVEAAAELKERQQETVEGVRQQAEAAREGARKSKDAVVEVERAQESARQQREISERQARAAAAAEARAAEWARVQQGSLREQAGWLARTRDSLKRGSTEWQKWEQESRRVAEARVGEDLNRLKDDYKLSRSYSAQAVRSEAEAMAVDGQRLAAKKARLRALLNTPGISADRVREINDALRETAREQEAYRQATRQSALEAQKSLENIKAPALKAKDRHAQSYMERLRAAWEREVKAAEKAAANHDSEGLQRHAKSAMRYAERMEALAGGGSEALEAMRGVVNALRQTYADSKGVNKGLSSADKEQREVVRGWAQLKAEVNGHAAGARRSKKALEEQAAAGEDTLKNERKLAEAKEKQAQAADRNARREEQAEAASAEGGKDGQDAQKMDELQQQLTTAAATLEGIRAAAAAATESSRSSAESAKKLARVEEERNEVIRQLAETLGTLASVVEKNTDALKKRLGKLEEQVKLIKKL